MQLKEHYLPVLDPSISGAHLHRCWHMLRDQEVQWPWYDGSSSAIRTITPDLNAWKLHVRLIDTLKQYSNAKDAISAALETSTLKLLPEVHNEVLVFDQTNDVRYSHSKQASNMIKNSQTKERKADPLSRARQVLEFLD